MWKTRNKTSKRTYCAVINVCKNAKAQATDLAVAILVIPIGLTAFQQQAYALRVCPGCLEFKKMTHEFEKTMIAAIVEGNTDGENDDLETHLIYEVTVYTSPCIRQFDCKLRRWSQEDIVSSTTRRLYATRADKRIQITNSYI